MRQRLYVAVTLILGTLFVFESASELHYGLRSYDEALIAANITELIAGIFLLGCAIFTTKAQHARRVAFGLYLLMSVYISSNLITSAIKEGISAVGRSTFWSAGLVMVTCLVMGVVSIRLDNKRVSP